MSAKELLSVHQLLADRVRLSIMAALAASHEKIDFSTLLGTLELTKGNLATHLRKLEEGHFITVEKEFIGRKPRTSYACTSAGRDEIERYLTTVEQALRQLRGKHQK